MTKNTAGFLSALVLLIATAACGGSDDPGDTGPDAGAAASVNCTIEATVAVDVSKVLTSTGTVACDGSGTIEIETCIQRASSGEFSDILCMSATRSDVDGLEEPAQVNCSTSIRPHRTRTTASINGTSLGEALSDEVVCN